MSRGRGIVELFVLAALTRQRECSTALLAGTHPEAGKELPSRSLRSSLNRALRRLEAAGAIERVEWQGCSGWRLDEPLPGGARMRTAYHEAGHAVVARTLSLPVKYATIKPKDDMLGHVSFHPFTHASKDVLKRIALMNLAGRYAETQLVEYESWHVGFEAHIEGTRRYGASVDRKAVRRAVDSIVGREYAVSGLLPAHRMIFKPDRRNMRSRLEREAKRLVQEHKDAIERVAQKLIDCETITGAQLDDIIAGY